MARHANVSVSTVSYVLNDSGPVAPARRARVLDAVRVLNYAPNEAARGLKRRSAPTIGLVVPELSNQFFALLAEGVEQVAAAYGVLVVLCAPEATDGAESLNGRLLRSQRLNGIIYLSGASTSPTSLLELTRLGPIVLVDEQVPGFDVPAVVSNNRRGAREVAQHVLEAGHRNIAVIGGPEGLWTAQQRLAGYREALAAAGIDPDSVPVFCGNYRQNSGTELAAKALSGPSEKRPTALLCANDLMAIGVLEYCRTEGIQVPEELSVVGFDDLPLVSLLTPRLTTVRQPARDMGERAARVLFDLIDGKDDLETPQPFPALLQIRDSVATPRGSS
ncbi:LacI family DNA-binding transcriptional regulator (plasmid) [Rhodococcus sp. ZPP]|nr:Ribose operon repressor [Rhodococcus sp. WAY2]QTJ70771.1 LacI family DNA-binding transcriptional regulator [Rhodococcus sp. ZPP]